MLSHVANVGRQHADKLRPPNAMRSKAMAGQVGEAVKPLVIARNLRDNNTRIVDHHCGYPCGRSKVWRQAGNNDA
jgi:hypothetical protein